MALRLYCTKMNVFSSHYNAILLNINMTPRTSHFSFLAQLLFLLSGFILSRVNKKIIIIFSLHNKPSLEALLCWVASLLVSAAVKCITQSEIAQFMQTIKRGFQPYACNAQNKILRMQHKVYASNARCKTRRANRNGTCSNLTQAISRYKFQRCHWPHLA